MRVLENEEIICAIRRSGGYGGAKVTEKPVFEPRNKGFIWVFYNEMMSCKIS